MDQRLEREMRSCGLCPRQCGADRTKGLGICSCGDRILVARAALHVWEEPCISGENGSGTVFFSGCPLKCVYCQNHEIALAVRGKALSIQELADCFLALQDQGAHNINLVTGVMYVPQIIRALDLVRHRLAIPVLYNSGGYERVDTLRRLEGYIDIYLPDLKYCSPALAARYSHAPDYFEVAGPAIAEMVRQTGSPVFSADGMLRRGVIVRHLCLPGEGMDSKAVLEYLFRTYGDSVYISVMNQYTPVYQGREYPKLRRRLTEREYEDILDFCAVLGIRNGFMQEGGTALESFIPDFKGEKS